MWNEGSAPSHLSSAVLWSPISTMRRLDMTKRFIEEQTINLRDQISHASVAQTIWATHCKVSPLLVSLSPILFELRQLANKKNTQYGAI